MKRITLLSLLFVLALITGCLPTYVGDPEKSVVDDHLLGVWHLNGSQEQLWFVQRLNSHQYLIQAYNFSRENGAPKVNGMPLTLTGWLTDLDGQTYLSMRMFDPQQLTHPNSAAAKNAYLVARIKLSGDSLSAEGVTDDFVKKYAIATPADFAAALTSHAGEKGAFAEANTYDRVDVAKPGSAGELIDLIEKSH